MALLLLCVLYLGRMATGSGVLGSGGRIIVGGKGDGLRCIGARGWRMPCTALQFFTTWLGSSCYLVVPRCVSPPLSRASTVRICASKRCSRVCDSGAGRRGPHGEMVIGAKVVGGSRSRLSQVHVPQLRAECSHGAVFVPLCDDAQVWLARTTAKM